MVVPFLSTACSSGFSPPVFFPMLSFCPQVPPNLYLPSYKKFNSLLTTENNTYSHCTKRSFHNTECNQFHFDSASLWNSSSSNNFTADTSGFFTHVVLSSENSNDTILLMLFLSKHLVWKQQAKFQFACLFVSSEWPGPENSIVVITRSYNMLITDFQTINTFNLLLSGILLQVFLLTLIFHLVVRKVAFCSENFIYKKNYWVLPVLFLLWEIYVGMNITDLIMLNYPQILRK